MSEHLTLRNGQQAVCNFILNWEHRHWVQYNAIFTENILKTALRILIFFCPQSQILQLHKCKTLNVTYRLLTILWFILVSSLYSDN